MSSTREMKSALREFKARLAEARQDERLAAKGKAKGQHRGARG